MELINPVTGKITSKFGYRTHPITGKRSFHNGVDIALVMGSPIKAPEAGKVTEVWDHSRGGLCLAMLGSSGRRYGCAHLSAQLRKVGEFVNQGDVIARSGNSGASTGPHLHFTVKGGGNWIDPQFYFTFK